MIAKWHRIDGVRAEEGPAWIAQMDDGEVYICVETQGRHDLTQIHLGDLQRWLKTAPDISTWTAPTPNWRKE